MIVYTRYNIIKKRKKHIGDSINDILKEYESAVSQ